MAGGHGNSQNLEYFPVVGDASELIERYRPNRVLVVGDRLTLNAERGRQTRLLPPPGVKLPTGIYLFPLPEDLSLMIVSVGADPGMPARVEWFTPDDSSLLHAYDWFETWWDEARVIPKPIFEIGDPVMRKQDHFEGSVRSRHFELDQWWYRARIQGNTSEFRESDLIRPEIDDDPESWIQRSLESAERIAATVTRAKLTEKLTDTVYSFRASRTVFRPYQFRPVLKLLESGQLRVLIADEVGLGKTIEAGLLWTELDARRQANRVLVVAPSGLVGKWRHEMRERFGYDLAELQRTELDDLLDRLEEDRFPLRFHGIVGVERLRTWGGLERLSELGPRFDLVIVDEAHVFRNSGTRSHSLGSLLSDLADAYVFLSATPLNLGNDDLFNLLELLAPGDFDDKAVFEQRLQPNAVLNKVSASLIDRNVSPNDRLQMLEALDSMTFGPVVKNRLEFRELVALLQKKLNHFEIVEARRLIRRLHALESIVTRTRKIEIQENKAVREPISIDVQWTPEEADLYRQIEFWHRQRAKEQGIPAGFATQMPMRLASTCLPAARNQVLARHIGSRSVGRAEFDDDLNDDDDDQDEFFFDGPPRNVVEAAHRLGDVDTKFDAFEQHLRDIVEGGRQVLVFSFSRPTLEYLLNRLSKDFRAQVLHGGVHRTERTEIITNFRQGEYDVLLASRVASEGLDFEFCSAVVNYDLPWNPMEVEQRIGRIDRIGQREDKILILNFHTPGTIETDIIERVHRRIGVFTASIGELEPIIRRNLGELRRDMFDFELSEEQRQKRIDQRLAAIEEQKAALEEVERASTILASTDLAEIDGLENQLVNSGRYVGQPELVHLVSAWIQRSAEARCRVTEDGKWLVVAGTPELAEDLRYVQAEGERSQHELEGLARDLRNGFEIYVSLEQEHARQTGATLLSANHPLVRAAIARPSSVAARFGSLSIRSAKELEGFYLVMASIARWQGVQPSIEIWTTTIDLQSLAEKSEVGDRLMAALAEGTWKSASVRDSRIEQALQLAIRSIRTRRLTEEEHRQQRNEALVEARRVSIQESFRRKRDVIQRRIDTATANQSQQAVRLQQSQLAMQDRLERDSHAELDSRRQVSMSVEPLAVFLVEVIQ